MVIRHIRRTTLTELERVFCRWIYFFTFVKKYFSGPFTGGEGEAIAPMNPPLKATKLMELNHLAAQNPDKVWAYSGVDAVVVCRLLLNA